MHKGTFSTCSRIQNVTEKDNKEDLRARPVETAGWFIKEKQSGSHQDLKSNANPSLLSPTDTTQMPIPNDRVGTILETHLYDGALNQCSLFRPRHLVRETKTS